MHSKNEENEEFLFQGRKEPKLSSLFKVLFYIDIVISEMVLVLLVIRGKNKEGDKHAK